MGFEPEHALAWRERARSSTARTFNKLCVAVLKTFEVDGNKPWKRAFRCFAPILAFLWCSLGSFDTWTCSI